MGDNEIVFPFFENVFLKKKLPGIFKLLISRTALVPVRENNDLKK